MNEQSRISSLKGVGEKTEILFRKAGVETVGDLIRYYPRSYDVYEEPVSIKEVEEGHTAAITGAVYGKVTVSSNKNFQITTLYLKDLTGTIKVVWYRMPFLRNTLSRCRVLTLRGKIVRKKDALIMEHPEIFNPPSKYEEKRDTLQPIYPLTAGLTNNAVIKAMVQAVECLDLSKTMIPDFIEDRFGLVDYKDAVMEIHFPHTKDTFYKARERLVFEEFLEFILNLRRMKLQEDKADNGFVFKDTNVVDAFLKKLPYELTGAQMKVWNEIRNDMQSPHVMSRLVQGDVGSGKTIVALLGLIFTGVNWYQGAMMAPTEVLAKQHYENFIHMFEEYDIPLKVELLTGSMTAKEKREAYARILSGEVQIIVGTHALIQDKVEYKNLALVVTDEQHRFGVKQREALAGKGILPHILVMSATPIPRTLAIILYGDLDISVINELPKNRLPIKNCVVDTGY